MKKVEYLSIASALALLVPASEANAKFNPGDGYVPRYVKEARFTMSNRDKDFDGKLTPEEFENIPDSRTNRRITRQEQKDGTYVEPSAEFKLIDTNEDGFATLDELIQYYKNRSDNKTEE